MMCPAAQIDTPKIATGIVSTGNTVMSKKIKLMNVANPNTISKKFFISFSYLIPSYPTTLFT